MDRIILYKIVTKFTAADAKIQVPVAQLFFKKYFVVILICLTGICSCSTHQNQAAKTVNKDLTHLQFSVEEAPEWTNLFYRKSGWFGGDGIFVLPQNGIDTASENTAYTILFSDTEIGEIENNKPKPGYVMIHNSVATLQGAAPLEANLQFHWDKKTTGDPESIFIPSTPASRPGEYYWLGDGFVNQEINGDTYIFGYRIKDVPGANIFGFEQDGSTFIIIPKGSKPPFKDQRQIDIPFFLQGKEVDDNTIYGSGILVNTAKAGMVNPDGYLYVYGIKGKNKELLVARVLPKNIEKFTAWKYWNGASWDNDMQKAVAITNRVSNELSISPIGDGRYALVFQVDGISTKLGLRLGASPVGPFGPIIELFDCKEAIESKKFFTYNAKAHPALSKAGELLVSYNVNSFDFHNDIKIYPNLYRPRFIRVKYQLNKQ